MEQSQDKAVQPVLPEQAALPFDNMVTGDGTIDDLAVNEEKHAGIKLGAFSSVMNLDANDIQIPRLRMMQGLSTEVQEGTAKPGQWVMTGCEPVDELVIIPLLFGRNRTLRDTEGSIICKSLDGTTGEGQPGGECATCPLNQWRDSDKKDGGRVPPACAFSYVYVAYVPSIKGTALIEFRRTSLNVGKALNTISQTRGLGNFAIKLKNSKSTSKKGTFFTPVVAPTTVEPALLAEAREFMGM